MYIFLDKVRWKYRHSSVPLPMLQKSPVVLWQSILGLLHVVSTCDMQLGVYTRACMRTLPVLQFAEHLGEVVPRSSIEQVLPYDLIRSAYLAAYEASQFGALDQGTDGGGDTPAAAAGD